MIADYMVIADNGLHDMANKVRNLIREGYEPMGGISVCVSQGNYTYYYQAMIKREEKTSL